MNTNWVSHLGQQDGVLLAIAGAKEFHVSLFYVVVVSMNSKPKPTTYLVYV